MITIQGKEIKKHFFPDGTFRINLEDSFTEQDYMSLFNVYIEWRWEDPSEYMMLYFITNHIKDNWATERINLYLPYVPDARMDRVKDAFNEVFTLKYFARFINSLGFSTVFITDPHSNVTPALFDRVCVTSVKKVVYKALEQSGADILYFPDEGAMKRYSGDYDWRPYLYGEKDRDWATGKINGVVVRNPMNLTEDKIKGKTVLIVDDICSKGGTFYHSGKALKEFGVGSIDLFITHCEQSVFDGKLLTDESPIRHIYTTDSLVHGTHPNLTTFATRLED